MSKSPLTDRRLAKAREHWSGKTVDQPARTRWWQSQRVLERVNRRICGEDAPGPAGGDLERLRSDFPGRTFRRGLSVGAGTGVKEMTLVGAGLVESMDLFELSDVRVELGGARARELGLGERVRFHQADAFEQVREPSYDLIYWNNALHHMLDVRRAVEWSWSVLVDGGVFYMNDFVGPARMQWSDETLEIASKIRSGLPERLRRHPTREGAWLNPRVARPSPRAMKREDPTECADSDRILEAVREVFPAAVVTPTGGVVYHLVLNDVLHNIDEVDDRELIDLLMTVDEVCSPFCDPHYCVAVGEKAAGAPRPAPAGGGRAGRWWRRLRGGR